jgi:hypothetical protein
MLRQLSIVATTVAFAACISSTTSVQSDDATGAGSDIGTFYKKQEAPLF